MISFFTYTCFFYRETHQETTRNSSWSFVGAVTEKETGSHTLQSVIFYKYQFSAISIYICTIHKPQACMPSQCSQCNVYLVFRISVLLHSSFSVCTNSFISFPYVILAGYELNMNGHLIDLLEDIYEILEWCIFKRFYFTCANIIRYLMRAGVFISYSLCSARLKRQRDSLSS